jgi:hypothetical protein
MGWKIKKMKSSVRKAGIRRTALDFLVLQNA